MSRLIVRSFEDGGNPRLDTDIIPTPGGVLLRPFSEDGDRDCKFHMNIELVNPTGAALDTEVEIEWFNPAHPKLHDYLILHSAEDRLTWLPSTVSGSRQRASLSVPPGAHCLCLYPRYEHARLTRLLDGLDRRRFRVQTIGRSRMGRDLHGVEVGDPAGGTIAIMARSHPYETVSSFFIEGMLHWLNDAGGADFLRDRRLAFVPMPNPDGVVLGYQKSTYGGLTLSDNLTRSIEPEAVAIRDYFVSLNPYLAADFRGWMPRYDETRLHGWMQRCGDTIKTNSVKRGPACYEAMIAYSDGIGIEYQDPVIFGHPSSICGLLQERCGADYFAVSWTPRGRSIGRLHETGVAFLKAIAS